MRKPKLQPTAGPGSRGLPGSVQLRPGEGGCRSNIGARSRRRVVPFVCGEQSGQSSSPSVPPLARTVARASFVTWSPYPANASARFAMAPAGRDYALTVAAPPMRLRAMHGGTTASLLCAMLFLSSSAAMLMLAGRQWSLLYVASWGWLGWVMLCSAWSQSAGTPKSRKSRQGSIRARSTLSKTHSRRR